MHTASCINCGQRCVALQAFLTRRHEKTGVLGGGTGPGPSTAVPQSSLGPQRTSLHTSGSRWSFSHSRVSSTISTPHKNLSRKALSQLNNWHALPCAVGPLTSMRVDSRNACKELPVMSLQLQLFGLVYVPCSQSGQARDCCSTSC